MGASGPIRIVPGQSPGGKRRIHEHQAHRSLERQGREGGALMSAYTFTSDTRDDRFGGWSRTVRVGEQEYSCSVRRGKSVRIPFKPRGKNRGWQYHGTVYRIGTSAGQVWTGRVPGSIGCRGLLTEAGILFEE